MTDIEKNVLILHDYAARYMLDAVNSLLIATDFDVTPDKRHKARDVAKHDLQIACEALEQVQTTSWLIYMRDDNTNGAGLST
jgi:hypothetical protein